MTPPVATLVFEAADYDLAATLNSGQAFRWRPHGAAWAGVVGARQVVLEQRGEQVTARAVEPADWSWLKSYLQINSDLNAIVASFPDDEPIRKTVRACRGLRLLRQDPWETLASFILSSTKQIVQIQSVIDRLCEAFGSRLPRCDGFPPACSFPDAARLAAANEADLRACKMGFRAPFLLQAAQAVYTKQLDLAALSDLPLENARARLMELPGVGRKIADCVLLFSCGFSQAFPMDVWILRALRELYFPGRKVSLPELARFAETHFGPHAGYAQQYLFHYMRTKRR